MSFNGFCCFPAHLVVSGPISVVRIIFIFSHVEIYKLNSYLLWQFYNEISDCCQNFEKS